MRSHALVVPFLVFLLVAGLPSAAGDDAAVTIVLVRHAETAGDTHGGGDPGLSEAGEARARALASTLADLGVTHLFASEFVRTQATLGPLADATGLEIVQVAAGRAADQLEALSALPPGSVAVVAGHSNTVPALVAGLGGTMTKLEASERHGALIPHAEYDRLIIVNRSTIELRY